MDDLVEAEQIDRDAALWMGRNVLRWTARQIEMTEAGEGDDAPLVQAFARHRLAIIPIVYEDAAKVASEWQSSLRPGNQQRMFGHGEAAKWIAHAIRSRSMTIVGE